MKLIDHMLIPTTTLREFAGGNDSNDAIEYFLHQKIGERTLFIESSSLLLFYDEHEQAADLVHDLTGSVCVEFAGVDDDIVPITSDSPHRRLGTIGGECVSAAMFHTALHSSSLAKPYWLSAPDGTSLGDLYSRVGIPLDQPIVFHSSVEALPIRHKRPTLRIVE